MREILFRGKRIDNGEWVEGYLCKTVMHIETSHQNVLTNTIEVYDGKSYLNIVFRNVCENSIGQFTGLTDKNGKKIFEGDICKDSLGIIFAVEWDNANGRFLGFTIGDRSISYVGKEPSVEVIGNIHDNPELLEVTDSD